MHYNITREGNEYIVSDATTVGAKYARKPRTTQKFSPVLITRADGSQSVITKVRKTKHNRSTRKIVDIPRKMTAADLKPLFAD